MEREHEPGCDGTHGPRQLCNQALGPQAAPDEPAAAAERQSADEPLSYCVTCGRANRAAARFCKRCGAQLAITPPRRASGLAFLLNEAQSETMAGLVPAEDRRRLIDHYERELGSLVARPAAAPQPRPAPAAAAVTPRPAAVAPSPPRLRPPSPPRPPRDWSWLAEQQANLFLFAGAFLVVVAALIYVAYSEQAVSGALKISMLTGFTLAFLAAGLVCLRIPRVVAAGHVFFAIGATLVPLGFVAAYTILSDRNLDPHALWLAGSLTSAALYTAVAALGLGRLYAFASGVALASAAGATAAVSDLPVEWGPAVFLALALAMAAVGLRGPAAMRQQVGRIWSAEAHVIAAAATSAAVVIALVAAPDEANLALSTRWFLPTTFAGAAAYACLIAARTREEMAGAGLIAAFGGATVTVVYAVSVPAEWYSAAFAALALLLGVVLAASEAEAFKRRMPRMFSQQLHAAGIAATITAVGVAFVMAAAGRAEDAPRYLVPETRWSAVPTLALVLAFYLLDAFGRRQRPAVTAGAIALAGLGASSVYGLDARVEYYALALTGAGIAMLASLRGVLPRLPERFVPAEMEGDTRVLAHAAVAGGVAVAVGAAWAAAQPEAAYAPQTAWFLAAAFASAMGAYALYLALPTAAARWQDRLAPYALGLALVGTAASVVYGLDASPEYYAVGFTGGGILLVAALHAGVPLLRGHALAQDLDLSARLLGLSGLAAGVGIAIAAASLGADPENAYRPETRWSLLAAFGSAAAGYGLQALLRTAAARWHDHAAHLAFGLALVGSGTSVVYGLDAGAEYYAFAFVTGAAAVLIIALALLPRVQPEATAALRDDYLVVAHAAAFTAGSVGVIAALVAETEGTTYAPDSRWSLPILFGALAGFYALAVGSRLRPVSGSEPVAALGFVAAVFGVTTGVVYALQASAEYYAFAFLVPAVGLGLAARAGRPRSVTAMLPAGWEDAAIGIGRAATGVGTGIAVIAAIVASGPESTYQPEARAFLPIAFLAAAAFLACDASRRRDWLTSTALLAVLGGAGITVVYALDAGAAYYGAAFAGVGLLFAFGGGAWSPRWLDERARDMVAVIAVTTAWLPFERVYADYERVGAGVHLAAALFYAAAAFASRGARTLGELFDLGRAVPVRLAAGWLYAAGLVATIGYVLLLRSMPAAEGADAGSLAVPLVALALGFLVVGATARYWRREFGGHLYVIGLLLGVASLAAAPDAGTLATLLTVLVVAFAAAAVWEGAPIAGVPAAVFGFVAVAAWRQRFDAPEYVIPSAYSAIAVAAYAAGYTLRDVSRRWSDAARACGAAYALVAAAAGFGILAVGTEGGVYEGDSFETTALYQWSTVATAVVGVLATVESSIARRGWVVVAGSAVLATSLLLEIGRFRPDSIQPYTATAGAYLVLLGLLGLWKFKLIPEVEDAAPGIEALGAAIVMGPSFAQSLSDGWPYQVLVLAEAVVFFTVSVALRRRLLLGASLLALVLVAGRALFDAINALPNWVVILVAGLALLGVGTAILIGRDRWARWEQAILSWWDQSGRPQQAG